MKKSTLIVAAMLTALAMSAQSPDTVTVIDAPNQVIITETTTGTSVKVLGQKNDNSYSYSYSVQHSSNDTVHTTSENSTSVG